MGRSKEPVPEGFPHGPAHQDVIAAQITWLPHNMPALAPEAPGKPLSPQHVFPVGLAKALEPSAHRLCLERLASLYRVGPCLLLMALSETQFKWHLQVQ